MPSRMPSLASWPSLEVWQTPQLDQAACPRQSHVRPFNQLQAWQIPRNELLPAVQHSRRSIATAFEGGKDGDGEGDAKAGDGNGEEDAEDGKQKNLDIMMEAIHSAEGALNRAMRSMSDSRMLHTRLGDLKAERMTTSLREALDNLIHDSSNLNDNLQKIGEEHVALEKVYNRGGNTRGAVKALADDVEKATATIDDMEKYIHRFYRRAWALTDVYNASSSQPSAEDMKEPPPNPTVEQSGEDQALKTSAGCECRKESTCAEHGRDFKWCVVKPPTKDGEKPISCPLYWDATDHDAAANDHRIAGTSQPPPMWDYCRMAPPEDMTDKHQPQQDDTVPAFAHRGCKCAYRGDLLGKYANNPMYKDKAGKFDWSRVPWSDRLSLEAMVTYYYRNNLAKDPAGGVGAEEKNEEAICVRTPSSGSLHICPAVNANQDSANPQHLGDPGWCGTHSWDFCVPVEPDTEGKDAGEAAEDNPSVNDMDNNAHETPAEGTAGTEGAPPTSASEDNATKQPPANVTKAGLNTLIPGLIIPTAQQILGSRLQDARRRSRRDLGHTFL